MPRTQTLAFDLARLRSRPKASLVVRLMMACNDMTLANWGQGLYRGDLSPTEKHLRAGAQMYFVRLQMAHLTEGMKVLGEILASPELETTVESCNRRAREASARLRAFVAPGAEREWFERNVAAVRHNLTFHYQQSAKLVEWALGDRASRSVSSQSSVTRSNHGHLWRFGVADDVVDSIVCRKIWHIPGSADLRKEADAIADRAFGILCDFMDFAGEFVWRYLLS